MSIRRFHTLDALRGVAALAVLAGHAGPLMGPLVLPHFTLAVDLFFMLSGYVIDHAYGQRLRGDMGPLRFMTARVIRLYPLYILGGAIGVAGAFAALLLGQDAFTASEFAVATLFTLLMLPSPTWQANAFLMPMNYPAWSLLFELFVNLVFALVARHLTTPRVVLITLISAIWLTHTGLTQAGLHDGAEWFKGWVGFPRVMFGFFAGVAIHRLLRPRRIVSHWAWLPPLALLPTMTGYGGGAGDVLMALVAFPLLIAAAASVEPPEGRSTRLFTMLGLISYPLYTMHLPIIQFIERGLTMMHIARFAIGPWAGLAIALGLCVLALLADRYFDSPVRRWLSARIGRSRITATI